MPKKKQRKQREPFGRIRKLPSGRYQAGYIGPDLALHNGLSTFETLMDARAWLAAERRHIEAGTWIAPRARNRATKPATLKPFANAWLKDRQLKPRTVAFYRSLLDQKILPELGDVPLKDITSLTVRTWYAGLGAEHPTRRAHAYALLRTILGSAVVEDLIPANPCHIRGAGNSKRVRQIKPASLAELEKIIAALPDRYGLMVLLASWCALRFGELTELRRSDVDLKSGKIMVRRGVVFLKGEAIVGTPKSSAGTRDVAIPPHLLPAVKQQSQRPRRVGPRRAAVPCPQNGWASWQRQFLPNLGPCQEGRRQARLAIPRPPPYGRCVGGSERRHTRRINEPAGAFLTADGNCVSACRGGPGHRDRAPTIRISQITIVNYLTFVSAI